LQAQRTQRLRYATCAARGVRTIRARVPTADASRVIFATCAVARAQQGQTLRDDHPIALRTGRVPPPPPPRLAGLAPPPPPLAPQAPPQAPFALQAPQPQQQAAPAWPQLTPAEARSYAAAFAAWDRDRDGSVTGAEMMPYFKQSRCRHEARSARIAHAAVLAKLTKRPMWVFLCAPTGVV
jgi:hypothetical protein